MHETFCFFWHSWQFSKLKHSFKRVSDETLAWIEKNSASSGFQSVAANLRGMRPAPSSQKDNLMLRGKTQTLKLSNRLFTNYS